MAQRPQRVVEQVSPPLAVSVTFAVHRYHEGSDCRRRSPRPPALPFSCYVASSRSVPTHPTRVVIALIAISSVTTCSGLRHERGGSPRRQAETGSLYYRPQVRLRLL